MWVAHHAILDGWSLPVLFRELAVLYDEAVGLPVETLPDAPAFGAYLDHIEAQDEDAARAYWHETLGDLTAGADIVIGRSIEDESGVFESHKVLLPPELVTARYNQNAVQVFGVGVSGRPPHLPGIEHAVGPYINVLPFAVDTDDATKLDDWLDAVQRRHRDNDAYNFLSFLDMQSQSALPPGERLCDSMFVFQNFPVDARMAQGLTRPKGEGETSKDLISLVRDIQGFQTTSYPITIFVVPSEAGLEIELLYDEGRFTADEIAGLGRHLEIVYRSLLTAGTLGDVDILDEAETEELIALSRGPVVPAPSAPSVISMFDAFAAANGDATALIDGATHVSYAQLNDQANRIAHVLQDHGVIRGDYVGIYMDRSVLAIASILAALKAGAAWLPMDRNYPTDRLQFMVEDSGAKVVVTDTADVALETTCPIVDTSQIDTSGAPVPSVETDLVPDDVACLLYTSGSTGQPKGVMAKHKGMLNRLHWGWREYPYEPGEVAALKTALSFGDSITEILSPLLQGVPLVMFENEKVVDTNLFLKELAKHKVSRIVVVPSLLRTMLDMPGRLEDKLPDLFAFTVSGEACTAELVKEFQDQMPKSQLLNFYGCTEAAGDSTAYDCSALDVSDPRRPVPIGRPIDQNATYILDRRLRPMPRGLAGELYIAADIVAAGYHGQLDLTAAAFVPDPYGDGLMFYTKDWARWDENDQIAFLGRQDGQVKIRGMRVELGEIETVLRAQPGVEDAVVKTVPGPGGALSIVAYWAGDASQEDLSIGLSQTLASHMVPQLWMPLEEIPLLASGKVNRHALPEPTRGSGGGQAVADASPMLLEKLRPLWGALLEQPQDKIPDDEDFFALGGHSLLAARAIAEVEDKTKVTLNIRQFYEGSSLGAVATALEAGLLAKVTKQELDELIEDVRNEGLL